MRKTDNNEIQNSIGCNKHSEGGEIDLDLAVGDHADAPARETPGLNAVESDALGIIGPA
jgi:hypothetical protein